MFDVVDTEGWNPRLTYSPAVRAGDFVFTAGFTATDENGNVLYRDDIVAQTREVYQKLGRILASVGGGLHSIVETTEFFIPDPRYKETARVRRELFGTRFPAATGIPVQQLIREGALIEVKAVAYVPNKTA